jgi:hypothetical protein
MTQKKRFTITAYREKTGAKAPQRLLDLRRSQLEISSKITKLLGVRPMNVPEIAKATGIPARTVLWYLMTYLKYNLISPEGKDDDGYYRYALKKKEGAK